MSKISELLDRVKKGLQPEIELVEEAEKEVGKVVQQAIVPIASDVIQAVTKKGLSRVEKVILDLANGYLFHNGDGIVKFRTDAEHNDVVEGNKFVEPPKGSQHRNF